METEKQIKLRYLKFKKLVEKAQFKNKEDKAFNEGKLIILKWILNIRD